MRYAWIERHRDDYAVTRTVSALGSIAHGLPAMAQAAAQRSGDG